MAKRYKKVVDQRFIDDLQHIYDTNLIDPNDWGLFQSQIEQEFDALDNKWEKISRKTDYPPLSTYDYRKRYVHSIPLRLKQIRKWEDTSSDFRIIFKVNEEKKEIFYFGIGKRIKDLPKNPNDIWAILNDRKLPEDDE